MEVKFDNVFDACLCVYSGGYCCAVQTSGKSTVWTVDIPEFDWESVQEQRDGQETVVLSEWIRAFKGCQHWASLARRDISGMWKSERYVQGLRDKGTRGGAVCQR
jgi:hypothetical protein